MQTEQKIRQNELKSLMARDKEIDVLFEKIYEDNALGKSLHLNTMKNKYTYQTV